MGTPVTPARLGEVGTPVTPARLGYRSSASTVPSRELLSVISVQHIGSAHHKGDVSKKSNETLMLKLCLSLAQCDTCHSSNGHVNEL